MCESRDEKRRKVCERWIWEEKEKREEEARKKERERKEGG